MFSHTSARGKILLIVYIDDIIITGDDKKGIDWDARMRPQGRRTHVRRGGMRQGRGRPRVRAASDRVVPRGKSRIGPTRLKSAPIRRKSAPTRPKSGRLGPYRPKRPSQAEIKKKKKKGANAPFY